MNQQTSIWLLKGGLEPLVTRRRNRASLGGDTCRGLRVCLGVKGSENQLGFKGKPKRRSAVFLGLISIQRSQQETNHVSRPLIVWMDENLHYVETMVDDTMVSWYLPAESTAFPTMRHHCLLIFAAESTLFPVLIGCEETMRHHCLLIFARDSTLFNPFFGVRSGFVATIHGISGGELPREAFAPRLPGDQRAPHAQVQHLGSRRW